MKTGRDNTDLDVPALAAYIDQTLLSPKVGPREAESWIAENADLGFATLCIAPAFVPAAVRLLAGSVTAACSVCGFPLGYALTDSKADEARRLASLGCRRSRHGRRDRRTAGG